MRNNKLSVLALALGLTFGIALSALPASAQSTVVLGADTGTFADGGIIRRVQVDSQGRLVLSPNGSLSPTQCTVSSVHGTTSVGIASTNVPAAALTNRLYTAICNSPQNAGVPIVKCRADNTAPVMAIANAGDVLEVGDCVIYTVSSATNIKCISDTAATYVTTFECK